jgi:ABC-2 type transport system permease protein
LILIVPQAFILFVAAAGLAINLKLPRLEWVSEINVVKQGAAAVLTLFGAMIALIFAAVLYLLLLRRIMDPGAFLWILALLFTVASAITGRWLLTSGIRAFEKL